MESSHNPHFTGEEGRRKQAHTAAGVQAGSELWAIPIDYALLPLHNVHTQDS